MNPKKIETRTGLPLTTVLRELVDKLNADDWARWATSDDASFYYVIGMDAWIAEDQEGLEHLCMSVGRGKQPISVIGEQLTHAKVASTRAADYYLAQARRRLEASGITAAQVEAFLVAFPDGDVQSALAGWRLDERDTDRFDALINLLHALALRRGLQPHELATADEQSRELEIAVEKVYLDELSRLFEGIVKRAGALEALTFNDQHLNEASRCYLYGFFKAAVILSSTAVERCLRNAVGTRGLERVHERIAAKKGGFYDLLIEESLEQGVLGTRVKMGEKPPLAVYSREIFSLRNQVAHEGLSPTSTQAEDVVLKAREVVEIGRTSRR